MNISTDLIELNVLQYSNLMFTLHLMDVGPSNELIIVNRTELHEVAFHNVIIVIWCHKILKSVDNYYLIIAMI